MCRPQTVLDTRAALRDGAGWDMAVSQRAESEDLPEWVIVRNQECMQFELVGHRVGKDDFNRVVSGCLTIFMDQHFFGSHTLTTWA